MSDDNRIFQAITRPSEKAGMPMTFHIVALSIPLMTFIMTQGFVGFWGLFAVSPFSPSADSVTVSSTAGGSSTLTALAPTSPC